MKSRRRSNSGPFPRFKKVVLDIEDWQCVCDWLRDYVIADPASKSKTDAERVLGAIKKQIKSQYPKFKKTLIDDKEDDGTWAGRGNNEE
jgi:hypothetical protein